MPKRKIKRIRTRHRPSRKPTNILPLLLGALILVTLGGISISHALLAGQLQKFYQTTNARLAALERLATKPAPMSTPYATPQHVVKVIDGDTVLLANGEQLRYLGIDTPEITNDQCYSQQATERNRVLVEDKDIAFYRDLSERDRFGRLLGYVYLADGTFVNELLVREGYGFAFTYPPDVSQHVLLRTAQQVAQSSSLGLWEACEVKVLEGGQQTEYKTNLPIL